MARPQFLIVGLALYLLGALAAVVIGLEFSLGRLLIGYLAILAAQLSVHFSNDYFDVASDEPGTATLISGGDGVLLQHPELREPVKWIAISLSLLSLAAGVLLMRRYALSFWIMGLVALGNLIGWFYSAPPLRLSYRGLGEVGYTLAAGFLVPAMGYFAMRGTLDAGATFFLIPLILCGLVSILSVEIPDMEADRRGGKQTWVARWGRQTSFIVAGCLLLAVTAYFFISPVLYPGQLPWDSRFIGLLSLVPLAPGLWAIAKKPAEKRSATQIATWIVVALASFSILLDGYLSYLASGLLKQM